MKYIAIAFVSLFLFCFGLYFLSIYIISKDNQETASFSRNIGKRIVLNNDTLTVTDYSKIFCTYTLSNGVKVDTALVNHLQIKN